ncbi:IPT/TIG domain-containing protein [Flavisolibacter nicotianae]|uniref:IPT/TIG domain-containing protein n=1 Tax=Flavisolibacter nicotianae TaxID=2364882 RepID=UPI000EB182E6|nr:IPT/TIG domain-containing protein [Flavisolibacter nicotianae]
MIQLTNSRLLTMLCLLLTIGVLASCKKENDNENDGTVKLLSFGPTGARHGDTLRFFGQNLDKVTEVDFTGTNAAVKQVAFKQQSSELILLLVPQGAEKGYVTLKTAQGDVVSKTQFNLNVKTSVTVASMTPQARPGENITLTGNYLNWVKSITFSRNKTVTSFVSKSLNQLVVAVPADAQTGPLVIAYTGTDSAEFQTADTLKVTLPMATGLSPTPVKNSENLTITGTNLDLAQQVLFNGVTAPVTDFVSKSATQLVVKVPAGAKSGKVSLVAASGVQTQSSSDLVVLLPTITAFSPSPVDPGTNVTITGTDLDLVDSVMFANAPAVKTFVSQSKTQLVVTVPMGVLRGKIVLGVHNSTLTVQSADALEITGDAPPPTIALPLYKDAVTANWNGWVGDGWGGTKDYNNTAPVREGAKSIKINYVGGWGSPFQLGGANVNTGAYTTFKLSIFGAAGSGGKKVNLGINGADKYTITVVEGKWTDYEIPLSSLTTTGNITDVILKEWNGTGGFTVFVDAVGLN